MLTYQDRKYSADLYQAVVDTLFRREISGLRDRQRELEIYPHVKMEIDPSFALVGRARTYASPKSREEVEWQHVTVVGARNTGGRKGIPTGPFGVWIIQPDRIRCIRANRLGKMQPVDLHLRVDDPECVVIVYPDHGCCIEMSFQRKDCLAPDYAGHPAAVMLEYVRQSDPQLNVNPPDMLTSYLHSSNPFFTEIHKRLNGP